ncbi:DUF3261 domain-containing protein [Paraglaciecola sp.]|uniref:DUF3261 domain-containing protein n=1 Tax=Paraglaciecola sp. TaxID=1920173 RepID=UPI0030F3F73E
MKHLLLLVMLCVTSACTSIRDPNTPIYLDSHSQYYLQAVPKALWGQATLQKLLITSPEGKHELLLQTELHATHINMVGLTSAGLVLFKLSWSANKGIKANTNILAKGLDAQVMLAYYQLANWPLAAIEAGLVDLHVRLLSTDGQTRNFFRSHELVFSVSHNQDYSLMTHYRDQYQIEIVTLQKSTLKN